MWPDLRTCLSSRLEPLFSLTCSSSTPRLLFWPVLPQVLSLFPAFVSAVPSAWFTLPPHLAWLTPHLSDLTSDLFLQRNLPGLLSWIRAILHFSVLALNNLLLVIPCLFSVSHTSSVRAESILCFVYHCTPSAGQS